MLFSKVINLLSHHADDQAGIGMWSASSAIIAEANNVPPLLNGVSVDDLSGRVEGKDAACVL